MKKISKIVIIVFMLLITACKTNDISSNPIDTNVIKLKGSGGIAQTVKTADNIIEDNQNILDKSNNKSKNIIDNSKNKQSSNIKNNDSNEISKSDEQMININITIDCKTILDNMDDLKNGYKDFIPKDGMILDDIVLEVKKDSTVLNVLEMVNVKYDMNLKIRKTSFGAYIAGIKYIEEKICGNSSGWMYSVNDVFPGQNANSYRLKDGDRIKWRFTCKPGDLK